MSQSLLPSQFRVLLIYSSAALSLTLMMLLLNIITIPEIIQVLGLSPHGVEAKVITNILIRIQEVTNNIIDIIAKLFSKVLNSFGMGDIDISKIKIKPGTHGIPPVEEVGVGVGEIPTENIGSEQNEQCDKNGICSY